MLTEIRVYENVEENTVDIILKEKGKDLLYQRMAEFMFKCIELGGKIEFAAPTVPTGLICVSDIKNRNKFLKQLDSYIFFNYTIKAVNKSQLYGIVSDYELRF